MVNPEHLNRVAESAWDKFRAKYPDNPTWCNLPEATRVRWRDEVVAGERVRNKVTTVFSEQCVFNALAEYHAAEQKPPVTAPEAPEASSAKEDKPKPKKGK